MSDSKVTYVSTDTPKVTTPEQGMLRQVLAYNPHLMLVRHKLEKGWKGARHSHPHIKIVLCGQRPHPFRGRGQELGDARRRQPRRRWRRGASGLGSGSFRGARRIHSVSRRVRVERFTSDMRCDCRIPP